MKIQIPDKDRQELDSRIDKEYRERHGKRSYYKTFAEAAPGMVHGPITGKEEQPRPFVKEVNGAARMATVPAAMLPSSPSYELAKFLDEKSMRYVQDIADARQPRYDWQKTVAFARMNGVRL